jgi:hypothetical protein
MRLQDEPRDRLLLHWKTTAFDMVSGAASPAGMPVIQAGNRNGSGDD